jgi:hypothetical protein
MMLLLRSVFTVRSNIWRAGVLISVVKTGEGVAGSAVVAGSGRRAPMRSQALLHWLLK